MVKKFDLKRANAPRPIELMEKINEIIEAMWIEDKEETQVLEKIENKEETTTEDKTLEELKKQAVELWIKNLHVYTTKNIDKLETKILEAKQSNEEQNK